MNQEKSVIYPVSRRYLDPEQKWPRLVLQVDREVAQSLQALADSTADVEQVGILGMGRKNGIISRFFPDRDARGACSSVQINGARLTQVATRWQQEEVLFAGIFHTHPTGMKTLSQQDLTFARQLIRENGMKYLLMGLGTPGRVQFFAVGE